MSGASTETVVVNDLAPSHPKFERERTSRTVLEPWTAEWEGTEYSQEPFLEYGPTFVNATCGIGAGKTVMGMLRAIANVEYWNPGETGIIISPTVPNLKNAILPEMRKWGVLDGWEFHGKGAERPGLHAPNGARVILESADNKRKIGRIRGPSVAWAWLDEPAEMDPEAFKVVSGRVRAGAYQNVFVTGTPKGRNWVWETFHPDSPNALDDVANVLGIPSFANPYNPETYHDILNTYDGRFFEQEALGRFVDFEGLVYRWFDDDNQVPPDDLPDAYDEVIYGLDLGGAAPTAITCECRAGDDWFQPDEFYERRVVDQDIASELARMEAAFGPGPVYSDHEPRTIDYLQEQGFNVQPAEKAVDDGIRLLNRLQDRIRVSTACQATINEFNAYQYRDDERDEVLKANDHLMDAKRYALYSHVGGLDAWGTAVDM